MKKYTWRILGLVVCLLLGLVTVSCQKEKDESHKKAYLGRVLFIPNNATSVVFEYNSSVNSGDHLESSESEVPIYGNLNGTVYTISTISNQIYPPSDCTTLFEYCRRNVQEIDFGEGFNTSNVTNMCNIFCQCSKLTSLDLSGWSTGNVTNMAKMFDGCSSLTHLNLSGWNTGNVTKMNGVFSGCSSLKSLDLSGWSTGNVTNMISMFHGCSSLTSLNLSGWNTENVTSINNMFRKCTSLTSLNLSGWNTENVIDMGFMFNYCSNMTNLNITSFNMNKVNYYGQMCYGLAIVSKACIITCSSDTRDKLIQGSGLNESYITWNIVGKK